MMIQLTVIVTTEAGAVTSVRTHAGLKDEALVRDYLSHLHDMTDDVVVEWWPIDQYSDVGDRTPATPVWRATRAAGEWLLIACA